MELDWEDVLQTARRVVRRYVQDPTRAEDLVQDAVVQVLTKIREQTGQGTGHAALPIRHLAAWLDRVIRNLAAKRANRRETARGVHETWHTNRASVVLPQAPSRVLVEQTLEHLSGREQALIVLSARGEKHREIAWRLGCSTQSVGIRLQRAQRKARRIARAKSRDPN